jgi:hypothetical protein
MSLPPLELNELLADARVNAARSAPGGLSLEIECQRRDREGQPLPPVSLTLLDVCAVAVTYDAVRVDARPSALRIPEAQRVSALPPWPAPGPAELTFNLRHDEDDLVFAPSRAWLSGAEIDRASAPVRLRAALEPTADAPWLRRSVWLGARALTARSGGQPLSLEAWRAQHERHWSSWAEGCHDAVELPTFDGLGLLPMRFGTLDLGYHPPARAPFAVSDTDCPPELLEPLRAWHEGHLARDWLRMARAFPHLDRGEGEHARAIEAECTGSGFGRWRYVDTLRAWWREGSRAGLALAGLEHTLGDAQGDDAPAAWRFGLRRRGGRWTIHAMESER